MGNSLVQHAVRLLVHPGRLERLAIVTYHRVLQAPDELLPSEPDVALFRKQAGFLATHMNVLPLAEALHRLAAGTLPPLAVSITFDDGYANNLYQALPVLESLGLPATVFVATGYLDGGCMFNDVVIETIRRCERPQLDLDPLGLGCHSLATAGERRAAIGFLLGRIKYLPMAERTALVNRMAELADVELPTDLMLTSAEVAELHRRGVEIGGHTVNHPILAMSTPAEARDEIANGAARLEEITGTRPRLFAYPNGQPGKDFGPEHAGMVQDLGFSHALTTRSGLAGPDVDPYQIPRITLWSRTTPRLAANVLSLYARTG
ncbi:MAG: polysaccharide deacetylase family protein [Gammaproteobacteria bacterium PRO9]|nr:polysaccharide deacetylase family protein [Gammaproteobacteria bacterium PRO9]